jgi:RNA polymerase sigma-70 factor (ECF subfamily)
LVNINSNSDVELLSKVAESDLTAFEQLYDRYSALLFSLIKKIVIEKDAAEKILQEVFIILWKRIEDLNGETENVFTLLVLLSRKKAFDYLKRKRNPEAVPEYNEEYECFRIIPNISKDIATVELNNALKLRSEMGKMISGLTDAQRYVLSLFYFDGYSEAEVAEKIKIPIPTVKSKMKVALDTLTAKTRELLLENGR